MDVNTILFELYSELRRVDRAILALQQLAPFGNGHGTRPLLPGDASRKVPKVDLNSDPLPHPS
jgi:hypothetical protein